MTFEFIDRDGNYFKPFGEDSSIMSVLFELSGDIKIETKLGFTLITEEIIARLKYLLCYG